MCKNGHKYRKLNETRLFCARCADIRTVGGSWSWTWKPSFPPYWTSNVWTSNTSTTNPNVTYTLWNDVVAGALENPNAEEREESNDRQD